MRSSYGRETNPHRVRACGQGRNARPLLHHRGVFRPADNFRNKARRESGNFTNVATLHTALSIHLSYVAHACNFQCH